MTTIEQDPFGGSLDVVPAHQVQAFIRERVAHHMRKAAPAIGKAAELEKLQIEMNSHAGPPTKEEIERHIALKYGSLEKAANRQGGASPIALASAASRENVLSSESTGF